MGRSYLVEGDGGLALVQADAADGFDPLICLPQSRFEPRQMLDELCQLACREIASELERDMRRLKAQWEQGIAGTGWGNAVACVALAVGVYVTSSVPQLAFR